MSKSIPCKLHRVHGCGACYYPAKKSSPFAMDSISAPKPAQVTEEAPLTSDELRLLRQAMADVKPIAKRKVSANDEQLRDIYGQPVLHELAANKSRQLVTKPLKYKPYKYGGN
jgi:hypothetical protein